MHARTLVCAALVVSLFVAASSAQASVYHFVPSPSDLSDLDHNYAYTWGMNKPWSSGETAVAATLTFKNIYNWDDSANILYIHLLDNAATGVSTGYDDQGGGDYFSGQGIALTTYTNLPDTQQTLVYTFTQPQLDALNAYAADGKFALGLDPDCHYYNCGVQLDVITGVNTPEPMTMGLLACGAGILVARRKRRK